MADAIASGMQHFFIRNPRPTRTPPALLVGLGVAFFEATHNGKQKKLLYVQARKELLCLLLWFLMKK